MTDGARRYTTNRGFLNQADKQELACDSSNKSETIRFEPIQDAESSRD